MRLAALALALFAGAAPAAAAEPQRIAWVWDGATAPAWADGAAVVVRHVLLRGDEVLVRAGTGRAGAAREIVPVVHVQVSTVSPPRDLARARPAIVAAMQDALRAGTTGWVQLDMEVRASQRDEWRALVRELRAALPREARLSVTALAWWCRSGAWLDGVEADEVVPMYFRMGRDADALRALASDSPERLHPACRGAAAGFSLQEPFDASVAARYGRQYWFDMRGWRARTLPPR